LHFEGNAQTLRLVTKLQLLNDDYGLNLTYGTLSALMKYIVSADKMDPKMKERPAAKKCGFFQSEATCVKEIQDKTGTGEHRHPLTYIMEACDDIAYSVLDAEDAAKKGLVSFADLAARLESEASKDPTAARVLSQARERHTDFRTAKISPRELDDISMQMFRVFAIADMVKAVTAAFIGNQTAILDGTFKGDLMESSSAKVFSGILKKFDREFAYQNREVLGIELQGHTVINGLMTLLWEAITERRDGSRASERGSPFANYAYGRISENYRRVFEKTADNLPLRYRELQLLTDMVSGMTDSYAVEFHRDLMGRRNGD
jgi:dGTPase